MQLDTDQPLVTGLLFQQFTQYKSTGSGSREFKVSANGGTSNAIDQTLSMASENYTYIAYGPVVSATSLLFTDSNLPTPNSGAFNFRVINAAAGIGPVDVYLTPAGTDLNATSPTVANLPLGTIGTFVNVNAGTLELRATATGTKDVIYDTAVQTFTSREFVRGRGFHQGKQQARRHRDAQYRQQRHRVGQRQSAGRIQGSQRLVDQLAVERLG